MSRVRYLATGMGHSGTGYVAKLLRSCGIKCGHENVFRYNVQVLGTDWEADSSFYAAPFVRDIVGPRIIHVVRNPVDVVRSYLRSGWGYENERFQRFYLPDNTPDDALSFATTMWVRWNDMIEADGPQRATLYRVEDRLALVDMLGLKQTTAWDNPQYNKHPSDQLASKHPSVIERCQKYNWETIGWGDMPQNLIDMAARYGYTP